jgi:hypothetical protein
MLLTPLADEAILHSTLESRVSGVQEKYPFQEGPQIAWFNVEQFAPELPYPLLLSS